MSELQSPTYKPFVEGQMAYWQNKHIGFNPYKAAGPEYLDWESGWYDASDEDQHYRSMSR